MLNQIEIDCLNDVCDEENTVEIKNKLYCCLSDSNILPIQERKKRAWIENFGSYTFRVSLSLFRLFLCVRILNGVFER